jgi:SAM-dependent methyltransferase
MIAQPDIKQFEIVNCALCGGNYEKLVIEGPDRNYASPGMFRVVRCLSCGLIYTNPRPRPEALGAYYPNDYGPHNRAITIPSGQQTFLGRWKVWIKYGVADAFYYQRPVAIWKSLLLLPFALWFRLLRVILLPSPSGASARLLDIGCGTGAYLATLIGQWPELYGVEPDEDAAHRAMQVPGLKIHAGTLESADFPDKFFDVVVLWHVLEHIPNPCEVLNEIRRILKPGGHVLIMVPNIAAFEFKLFGINWMGLDVPRHLYHFSPDTLQRMLTNAGLGVLRVNFQIEAATIESSLRNLMDLKRRDPGGIGWKIARLFLWGLSFLLAQLKTSGIMVIYARRDERAQ